MNALEILGIWIITASLGVSLAAPIGPINLELMKNALNTELTRKVAWFTSLIFGIGAMTGDFIIALSAVTLGGEVLESIFGNLWLRFLLFAVNFIILSYLGISTLLTNTNESFYPHNSTSEGNESVDQESSTSLGKKYVTGFSLVITSPWTYLWWSSFGTLVLFTDFDFPQMFIVLMFLSGIFLWLFTFSTVLTIIRKFPNPKVFTVLTKGTALILLIFALFILSDMLITFVEIVN